MLGKRLIEASSSCELRSLSCDPRPKLFAEGLLEMLILLRPVVMECLKLLGGGDGAGESDGERDTDGDGREGECERDNAGEADDEPEGEADAPVV